MKLASTFIEFTAPGAVELRHETIETGDLGPDEVVIRNEATLVSAGTELAALHGEEKRMILPRRPGYAAVGRIEAIGANHGGFEVGQRVYYAGQHASCQRFLHNQDSQWGRLYPVPDELAPDVAAFGALAQIAFTAPCVTQLDLGDSVAVFGLGLVGNLAAQLFQLRGARVIALDPVAQRCELARGVGLATALAVAPDSQVAAITERTGGEGAHVCVDAAGHSAVVEQCVAATRTSGQVILLGTPRAPYQTDASEMLLQVHRKGLVVRGAHQRHFSGIEGGGAKQTAPWAYATVFDLMLTGQLQIAPLCSHFVRPERAPEIYRGLRQNPQTYWGAVFDWRS